MIRSVNAADAGQIADIYNYYVRKTIVTFDEEEITPEAMAVRIKEVTTRFPWIVWETDGNILGYAYGAEWKSRCAYKTSAEISIYLRNDATGKQLGTKLYTELLDRLKQLKLHVLIGGISLPNEASIRLHEKFGFEKVAQFKEVGLKFDRFIDVGYWELILD